MRLIEAEKAKDVIHEYFKSLMANGASGTDVDRLAVGIGSCLKHDANLLKAIDELPSAEPDTTTHDSIPAETGKNDGDKPSGNCISRAQAIDALRDYLVEKRCPDDGTLTCRLIENEVINKLPSAQPERKTGRWIPDNTDYYRTKFICSACGESEEVPTTGFGYGTMWDYCPMCGAKMEGGEHEEQNND